MRQKNMYLFMAIAFVFVSCTYDDENDLIPRDDTKLITYEADIKPIMQSSCIGCHANPPRNGAPFSLVDFSQVRDRSGAILNAISRQTGSARAMPPSGRLPQSTIDLVDQWIQDGLQEN